LTLVSCECVTGNRGGYGGEFSALGEILASDEMQKLESEILGAGVAGFSSAILESHLRMTMDPRRRAATSLSLGFSRKSNLVSAHGTSL
jgi:hypothetical protein